MSITYRLTEGVNNGSGNVSVTTPITTDEAIDLDVDITAATTNSSLVYAINKTKMKLFYLLCDQNTWVRINANAGNGDNISLVANIPFVWRADSGYFANPFTGNITSLVVSMNAAVDASFQIRSLQSAT